MCFFQFFKIHLYLLNIRRSPAKLEAQLLVGEVLVNSFLVFVWSLGMKNKETRKAPKSPLSNGISPRRMKEKVGWLVGWLVMSNGFSLKKNEGEGEVIFVLNAVRPHIWMQMMHDGHKAEILQEKMWFIGGNLCRFVILWGSYFDSTLKKWCS